MKIYVKQLVALATSKAPPDRAGWLLKRGEVNKSFQKRWFVLRGNLLFYFERPDREPVGLIVLEGCSIELAECSETERYAFLIIFHGQGARTYTLAAESQEDMEAWMKALSCANYDFLRNTVAELQRQIDEIRSSAARVDNANAAGVGSDSPLGPDATSPKAQSKAMAPASGVRETKTPIQLSALAVHDPKAAVQPSPALAAKESRVVPPVMSSSSAAKDLRISARSIPQSLLNDGKAQLPHSLLAVKAPSLRASSLKDHKTSLPIPPRDSRLHGPPLISLTKKEPKHLSNVVQPHPPNAPPRKKNNNNTSSKSSSQTTLDGLNSLNLMKTAMTFDDLHAKYGAKIQEVFNTRVIDFL